MDLVCTVKVVLHLALLFMELLEDDLEMIDTLVGLLHLALLLIDLLGY